MGLTGKLICQTGIKSDGDVFHELFSTRPHHVSNITPANVLGYDLHEGEFGKVGSVVIWNYSIGKLICQTGIKSDGDVFHELFSTRPHHVSNITPANVQGCDLHEGEFGKVGSVIIWNYSIDGKALVAKEEIVAIDEEDKSVTFKVVEGHLLEEFKIFVIRVHVDTKGEDNLVIWTIDYEKLNESVKDPTSYLDLFLSITRDIEAHHLPK